MYNTVKGSAIMKVAACLVGIAGLAAAAADLPPELQHLETMKADQAALVDAVRAMDKAETTAAENEVELAAELAKQDKKEEAAEKQENAAARITKVRTAYEWLLEQYPKNPRAHNYYGELLYDRFGDQAGALKEWNLAISLDAEFSPPHNNLAIHYCHTGQYRLGLEAYDRALELDPGHPDYLFNLTQAYLLYFPQVQEIKGWSKAKVYKQAMKLSKKAKKAAPDDYELAQDYANNFYAAEMFGVRPNWRRAAGAWEDARELARNDVERFFTWLNEGRVWKREGNKDKAAECLNEAVKLRPNEPVPKRLLAEIQAEQDASAKRPVFFQGRSNAGSR